MRLNNPEPLIIAIRNTVRIKSKQESIMEEIDSLIGACKTELEEAGVEIVNFEDKLTLHALKLYAKANYTYNANDNKRFMESFDMVKRSMCLSSKYKVQK